MRYRTVAIWLYGVYIPMSRQRRNISSGHKELRAAFKPPSIAGGLGIGINGKKWQLKPCIRHPRRGRLISRVLREPHHHHHVPPKGGVGPLALVLQGRFLFGSPLDQVANIPHIDFMSDLTGRFRM